jgi:hypothetical protein
LGFATGRLIEHDTNAPGVIRRLLCSGPMRRQAVFAAIASEIVAERHQQITGEQDDHAAAVSKAEVLRDGRAREVIGLAIGDHVPDGLLGALERVGLSPLKLSLGYRRLIDVFMQPEQRHIADGLRYVGAINDRTLMIIDKLPPFLIHPQVLSRLDSVSDARAFVEAVAFAQTVNSTATDERILGALAHMGAQTTLPELIARFVRRADRELGEPIPADNEVTPIHPIHEMIVTSRRFRNCLGTNKRIVSALRGRTAYANFKGLAIMEFVALSDSSWVYAGSYGVRNETVGDDVETAARAKCAAAGVPFFRPGGERTGPFATILDPYDHRLIDFGAYDL